MKDKIELDSNTELTIYFRSYKKHRNLTSKSRAYTLSSFKEISSFASLDCSTNKGCIISEESNPFIRNELFKSSIFEKNYLYIHMKSR